MTNETPEGCLPFDLTKALAGWPCVSRDGREVRISFVSELENDKHRPVLGWINDGDEWLYVSYDIGGKGAISTRDLFLKKKTKTLYANLYKNTKEYHLGIPHNCEEEAIASVMGSDRYIKTISFEVECDE